MTSLLFGCSSEPKTSIIVTSDEQEVLFDVLVPGGATREGGTISDDEIIKELDLLVFKGGKYQYRRLAYPSGGKFRATLKIDNNITIYAFANSRSVLDGYDDGIVLKEENDWETQIRKEIVADSPILKDDGKLLLPMWGVKDNVTLREGIVNNIGMILLLRSVASADVAVATTSEFELVKSYLYFAASKGILAPNSSSYDHETFEVSVPESPDGMMTEVIDSAYNVKSNSIINQLYMFENDTDASGINPLRSHTRLVVGGKYKNSEDTTYYPIDFIEDNEVVQVMRNCKYDIKITSVNSEGYPSSEIASKAAPVNMDFSVVKWHYYKDYNIGIDGPDYLSLGSRKVLFERYRGETKFISLNTTFDIDEITMYFIDDDGNKIETVIVGNEVMSDRFKAEIITEGGKIASLKITALEDYNSLNVLTNKQILRMEAGRIEFDITLLQTNNSSSDWGDGGNTDEELGESK